MTPLVSTGFTDFVVLYDQFGEQRGPPVCCSTAVVCSGISDGSVLSHLVREDVGVVSLPGGWRTRTGKLTSAGIVLHKELVQGAPSSSDTNHHGGPQDPHQTQLLGISKLNRENVNSRSFSETQTPILPGIFPLRPGRP